MFSYSKRSSLQGYFLLLFLSSFCYCYDYQPMIYGPEVCTFDFNGINRQCDVGERGSYISVNVITCGSSVGNYLKETFDEDVVIPSNHSLLCNNRFSSSRSCPSDVSNVTSPITGNAALCSILNCTSDANCYCSLGYRGLKRHCGGLSSPEQVLLNSMPGIVAIPEQPQLHHDLTRQYTFNDNVTEVYLRSLSEICKIFVHPSEIILKCDRTISGNVHIFSSSLNNVYRMFGSAITINLPKRYKNHAMHMNLVLNIQEEHYYKRFLKKSESFCESDHCLYCEDAWDNWSCLSGWEQFQFGLVCTLVLISFFLILPILGVILLLVALMFKYLYEYLELQKLYSKYRSEGVMTRSQSRKIQENFAKFVSNTPRYVVILMLIAPLVLAQCDIGQTSSAFVTQCHTAQNGIQTCTLQSLMDFSIDSPGQRLCASIIDNTVQPAIIVGSLTIEYVVWTCNAYPNLMYYTREFDVGSESNHNCYQADSCDDTDCASINANGYSDRQAMGELSASNLLSYPGYTQCIRSNPLVTDLCFFNTPGCIFTGWWLDPSLRSTYGVYNFPNQICGAVLKVEIDLPGFSSNATTSYYSVPGTQYTYSEGSTLSITLDGTAGIPECYDLRDIKGMISPGFRISDSVSQPGFPEAHKLGDIQGSDPWSSFSASSNSLQIDYNIVNVDPVQSLSSQVTYTVLESGLKQCLESDSFCHETPYTPDGITTIYVRGLNPAYNNPESLIGSVYTVCPEGPAVLGSLSLSNYTFIRTINSCEFELDFKSITGCYNCQTCAFATFEVSSESACSASVTATDVMLRQTVVDLSDGITIDLPFCSNKKSVDSLFTFYSNDYSFSVDVTGTLQDPTVISSPNLFNDTVYYSYMEDSSSGGFASGFTDWLNNLFDSWWSYILLIIFVGLALLLFLFLAWQAIFTCIPFLFMKISSKKQE